jgi:hypothetical protein
MDFSVVNKVEKIPINALLYVLSQKYNNVTYFQNQRHVPQTHTHMRTIIFIKRWGQNKKNPKTMYKSAGGYMSKLYMGNYKYF